MVRPAFAILLTLLLAAGCAQVKAPDLHDSLASTAPAPAPAADPKSLLTLDQIPPPTLLPEPRPATQPDELAPAKSLALYGSARAAMDDNQPLSAVTLLQQAIALDPDSFELYRALGEAQLASLRQPNEAEFHSFEKALELRPDNLRLQALLGAQYAAANQLDNALRHLRLSLQTRQYQQDEVAAAAVDLLLARLLQQEGYDTAALDRYHVLLGRLDKPSFALRADPDLGPLTENPQSLWLEVGFINERRGNWAEALAAYEPQAKVDPSNFELQAKVVRMLSNLGRTRDAVKQAADVVLTFDASADSLALLKSVCADRGVNAVNALTRIYEADLSDNAALVALAAVLTDAGQTVQACTLLQQALAAGVTGDANRQVCNLLFGLYLKREDVPSATRLLIVYLAQHPDQVGEAEDWWDELLRPSQTEPLRLVTLQHLAPDAKSGVDPKAFESAKLFLVWRLADLWRRDTLARSALEQSVATGKPFPAAYRQLVLDDWARDEWDESHKQQASDDLAASAEKAGDPALADEVRGLADLSDKRPADATVQFEQAIVLGGSSPQLLLTYASALHNANQDTKAQQILWKLVGERPQDDQAWQGLFQFYQNAQDMDQQHAVLAQWLGAIPASVQGRLVEANFAADEGNTAAAEQVLLKVFTDHDDNPDVIASLVNLGARTGRLELFINRLEELRHREPGNSAVLEWLVEIYTGQGRPTQAAKVLDEARAASAKDADLLYQIAHLYEKVDQTGTTTEVLQQVVNLDPNQAAACNDLGFTWADEGVNLNRAEKLIRVAVAQEPDNESYLDSLGWVLYKEGQFAESEQYMQKAVSPAVQPDPVVLDHYGDVLYRLGRGDDAARQWQRSLTGIDLQPPDRQDLKGLKLTLQKKLAQQKQGEPVSVAPIADAR
jgi:predicted Zn-dependent protease